MMEFYDVDPTYFTLQQLVDELGATPPKRPGEAVVIYPGVLGLRWNPSGTLSVIPKRGPLASLLEHWVAYSFGYSPGSSEAFYSPGTGQEPRSFSEDWDMYRYFAEQNPLTLSALRALAENGSLT